jgi:hypothetical protein
MASPIVPQPRTVNVWLSASIARDYRTKRLIQPRSRRF